MLKLTVFEGNYVLVGFYSTKQDGSYYRGARIDDLLREDALFVKLVKYMEETGHVQNIRNFSSFPVRRIL